MEAHIEPTKIIESLARIEEQNKTNAASLLEIKQNLTLGEGSTLRDSVKRVLSEEMKVQYGQCGRDMHAVAESSAGITVAAHVREYHQKASVPPSSRPYGAIIRIDGALVKRVLPWVFGATGSGWAGFELMRRFFGG